MTFRACLVVAVVHGLAPAAGAAPPEAKEVAERLHAQAVATYKSGALRQAIELWREALALDPHWKYSYNLANGLYEDSRSEGAWDALVAAEGLGIPSEHLVQVSELRAKIASALTSDHAWIELDVEPEGADVVRNGAPWPAPRGAWTRDAASQLRVARDGYAPAELTWDHPIGRRHRRAVRLQPLPATGTLQVTGGPAGATVRIDGQLAGHVPFSGSIMAGEHVISVAHPSYTSATRRLTLSRGATERVELRLTAEPPPVSSFAKAGWATLGAGLGVVGIGVGLLVWSDGLAAGLDDLNADGAQLGTLTYEAYVQRFERDRAQQRDAAISGWTLLAAGAASAATGTVLLLLDRGVRSRGDLHVGFLPTSGGGAVFASAPF